MQYKINKSYILSHYLKIFILLKFYVGFLQTLRKIEKLYNFDLDGERIVLDDEEKPNRQTNNNKISSRVFLHEKGSGVLYIPPRGHFTEFKKVYDGTFLLKLANGVLKYFDSFGRKRDVNDPTFMSFSNGFTISHDLDGFKNVRKITSNVPDLNHQYNYSDLGQLEKVTDPMGLITTYEYYSELAPGGGEQSTGGRALNSETGGYLKSIKNPFFTEHFDKYDERGNVTEYRNEKIDSQGDKKEIKASYTYHPDFNKIQYETIKAEGSSIGSSLNYSAEYRYFENNGNLEWKRITYGTGSDTITNKFKYTYWEGKTLVKTVEMEGQKDSTTYSSGTTTYYYKNNNNIWKIEGPEGKIVYSYNQRNLVSGITVGEGDEAGTYHFTYDGNGNRTSITDPKGNVTTYEYDGFDRLRKVIDPDPFKTETVIERQEFDDLKVNTIVRRKDSGQNILQEYRSESDPVNRTNTYTIVDPGGEIPSYTSTYTYRYRPSNIGGETITITDSLGRQSTVTKNKNGKVVEEVDFAGNKNEYQYENGNIIKKIEHEKKEDGTFETYTTEYKYNAFDQVEEIKEYDGELAEPLTTMFIYNDMGKLNNIRDSEGNTTTIDYDAFGRKGKTKKHMKKTGEIIETEFEYYNNNLLKSIKDANGNITEYEYDSQKRLSRIIYFDGTEIKYEYDLNGNVHKVSQRNLTEVTDSHDELNRLTNRTIQYNEGGTASESYGYDDLSRLISAENNDSVVNMQYDAFNRIIEESRDGKAVTYNYENLSGNNILRQTITYPGQQQQKVVERTFDILNRISEIKEGNSTIASMTHIGRSFRLSKKQYGNGDTINFLYDRGRRMSDLEVSDKNSNIILKYAFGYNNVNMKTADQRGHDNNKGDLFEYDSVYRLTRQTFNVVEPLANKDVGNSYTLKDFSDPNEPIQFEKEKIIAFDKVDNIKKIIETQNQTIDEINTTIEGNNAKLNQYTTFDQWGLDYDANGNTTQKGTQFFTYDYRNQLVSVTDSSDNSTVNYKYDALGRQIEKTLATGPGPLTTKYFYSGNQVIEERDGSDNVLKQYIYGNGIDEIIRMDRNENGTMVPYYFHTNSIGSIVAISDQDGQLVERISYDIYGMPTFTDYKTDPQDPTVVENSVIGNDILFHGRRYDKETNLYYYRARYFDPIMGRFLQTDPMGFKDSMNLYQGFNMNPMNFVDPFGLWTQKQRHLGSIQIQRALVGRSGALDILKGYREEFGELTNEDINYMFGENDRILNTTYVTLQDILNLAGAKIALGMKDLHTNYNIFKRDDFQGFSKFRIRTKTEGMIETYNSVVGHISRMNRISKGRQCTSFKIDAINRHFSYIDLTTENYEGILSEQMELEGQSTAYTFALTSTLCNMAVRTNILQRSKFIKRIFANPDLLKGKMPADLEAIIGKQPGWKIETLGKGKKKGMGWVFREYTIKGDPTGRMIRWHPGGGHHGPEPYWRVTGGPYGKSDIIR